MSIQQEAPNGCSIHSPLHFVHMDDGVYSFGPVLMKQLLASSLHDAKPCPALGMTPTRVEGFYQRSIYLALVGSGAFGPTTLL